MERGADVPPRLKRRCTTRATRQTQALRLTPDTVSRDGNHTIFEIQSTSRAAFVKNGINKNLPHTAIFVSASFLFVCVCLCVVCHVEYIQDVGVLSSAQNGGGKGGGHGTLVLSGALSGEGRVEGTDHGSGGLGSKNGFRDSVVSPDGRNKS
jgi:hypothetical protein